MLMKLWESVQGGSSAEVAYVAFEVPPEINEGMLITVYQMRVSRIFFDTLVVGSLRDVTLCSLLYCSVDHTHAVLLTGRGTTNAT